MFVNKYNIEWTSERIAFLKDNFEKMSNREMAKALGYYIQAVRDQLYSMGLYRMTLEYWTEEQINFLKRNYKKIGDKELAILFNLQWEKEKRWTFKHIEKKRLYLKLKRTPAQLRKIKIRNAKRGCWMNTGTWETRGVAAVGTVRIWNHGGGKYKFKAIKTENGFVHYAPWLYEKTYGPMPANHIVGFKDRDNMNVVPENLEAITRAEHARRGGGNRKLPAELKDAEKMLNQLNQLIKTKQNGKDYRQQRQHIA
jgi:hypothetical protein